MWKAGQLVTIDGVVYRVKRLDRTSKVFPCQRCIFEDWLQICTFPGYKNSKEKYSTCIGLIPDDCYFERVSP